MRRGRRHARIVSLCTLILPILGCDGFPGIIPFFGGSSSGVKINYLRRGCSEFSRSVELKADSPNPASSVQWFFTDGTSQLGQTVIHTFQNAGPQEVTAIVDGQVVSTLLSVPVRGDAAPGPDPFGDDCIENEREAHVPQGTTVEYRNNPPASGPHYSGAGVSPIDPGFYVDPVPPEVWVHNLEHGDIVILFDCPGDCPQSLLLDLQRFFAMVQHQVVITRYPGLTSPIMAVAWDVQRRFDAFDAIELKAFHDRRVGQAPEGDE
jgi:hypothetical protein